MNNKKVIAVLIMIVLVFSAGYIIYKKCITNKKESKIEYRIDNGKLYINDKESELYGLYYNVIGQIKDVLIVESGFIDSTPYVLNKDGKIEVIFLGNNSTIKSDAKKIYVKGNVIRENIKIDDDSIIVKSDNLSQDPEYVVCGKDSKEIVEYEEKFKYKSKTFELEKVLKEITASEYIKNNRIICE